MLFTNIISANFVFYYHPFQAVYTFYSTNNSLNFAFLLNSYMRTFKGSYQLIYNFFRNSLRLHRLLLFQFLQEFLENPCCTYRYFQRWFYEYLHWVRGTNFCNLLKFHGLCLQIIIHQILPHFQIHNPIFSIDHPFLLSLFDRMNCIQGLIYWIISIINSLYNKIIY